MRRKHKRITVFAGHYGSGKTTVAVNYALWLRASVSRVAVCDIDIVNPYYRAADWVDILRQRDIELISSEYANTNVETPYIPSRAQTLFDDRSLTAVVDAGGDEQGALALGRYARFLRDENDCEMLMVINRYRPLTREAAALVEIRHFIEAASGVRFAGLVNASNLGAATTADDVRASFAYAWEASQSLALPVVMTAVCAEAASALSPSDHPFVIIPSPSLL